MLTVLAHIGKAYAVVFCATCVLVVVFLSGCREKAMATGNTEGQFTDYINNAQRNTVTEPSINEARQSNAIVNMAF